MQIMQITGVLMNTLTKKIKNKGYSLTEFCDNHRISLRSYRTYEKEDHKLHNMLCMWIDNLTENKK
jgi:hypothetical protein